MFDVGFFSLADETIMLSCFCLLALNQYTMCLTTDMTFTQELSAGIGGLE